MIDPQERILTPEEVTIMLTRLDELRSYLTPTQAVTRMELLFSELHDSIHSGYLAVPEYCPDFTPYLSCIESHRSPPSFGSLRYPTEAVDRFFLDVYAPSICYNGKEAA